MKNLCLTCKVLREITVRQLYRNVELDVGCEADLKISAFLGRSNPGLEHIRTLLLNPEPEDSPVTLLPRTPSPQPPPAPPPFAPPPPVIIQALANPPLPVPPAPPAPGTANQLTARVRVVEEKKKRWRPAHFTVRLLIELLPEHILEKFRYVSFIICSDI